MTSRLWHCATTIGRSYSRNSGSPAQCASGPSRSSPFACRRSSISAPIRSSVRTSLRSPIMIGLSITSICWCRPRPISANSCRRSGTTRSARRPPASTSTTCSGGCRRANTRNPNRRASAGFSGRRPEEGANRRSWLRKRLKHRRPPVRRTRCAPSTRPIRILRRSATSIGTATLYRNPDRRRALSFLLWPTEKPRANRKILVAGCGTSQADIHALREPHAHVTAIDISETSLRHMRDLQQKYRLRNLDLHRLAIERVGELGQTFDQIVCTGVLHHLADPDVGLRSLRNVLVPNGAMQLMVYATYGRAGIYMMQEYCRLLGVGASEAELRDLDTTIGALSSDHPVAGVSRRAKDFRNPDALADALLHPQDRAYTVPQLYAWLERCGLSFGRWFWHAAYLPQCGAIARTPNAARLASLSTPIQHAACGV